MKLNKLLVSLALVATATTMVACGSGSSGGSTGPAAPVVTPVEVPAGFAVPANSDSGIAFNAEKGELAIPAGGSYTTIQLSAEDAILVADAIANNATLSSSPNGDIIITPATLAAGSNIAVIATGKNTQSSLTATATVNIYTLNYTPTTNFAPVNGTFNGTVVNAGLVYGTDSKIVIATPNGGNDVTFASTACSGTPSTISLSHNHNVDYIAFGTNAQTSNVCVASGKDLSVSNLAAEAPAADQANGYQGGSVAAFGFPYSQNQSNSLVGYWTVGTQIYKVLGTITNNTPTGTGFINTTSTSAQKANGSAQATSFTNVPSNINSTFVDNSGNVWVGTTGAQVYVLRNGATAWTNSTPTGATGAVTVSTNYTSSGATAVIGGKAYSVK